MNRPNYNRLPSRQQHKKPPPYSRPILDRITYWKNVHRVIDNATDEDLENTGFAKFRDYHPPVKIIVLIGPKALLEGKIQSNTGDEPNSGSFVAMPPNEEPNSIDWSLVKGRLVAIIPASDDIFDLEQRDKLVFTLFDSGAARVVFFPFDAQATPTEYNNPRGISDD